MTNAEKLEIRFSALSDQILGSNNNVDMVSYVRPQGVTVFYAPGATAGNITAVEVIIGAFNWTPRTQKTIGQLITEIAGLSAADRNKLFAAVSADFLRRNPRFAERFGLSISGDE